MGPGTVILGGLFAHDKGKYGAISGRGFVVLSGRILENGR